MLQSLCGYKMKIIGWQKVNWCNHECQRFSKRTCMIYIMYIHSLSTGSFHCLPLKRLSIKTIWSLLVRGSWGNYEIMKLWNYDSTLNSSDPRLNKMARPVSNTVTLMQHMAWVARSVNARPDMKHETSRPERSPYVLTFSEFWCRTGKALFQRWFVSWDGRLRIDPALGTNTDAECRKQEGDLDRDFRILLPTTILSVVRGNLGNLGNFSGRCRWLDTANGEGKPLTKSSCIVSPNPREQRSENRLTSAASSVNVRDHLVLLCPSWDPGFWLLSSEKVSYLILYGQG